MTGHCIYAHKKKRGKERKKEEGINVPAFLCLSLSFCSYVNEGRR